MRHDTRRLRPVPAPPDLSVVVPMHNEARNIDALFRRLLPVLEGLDMTFEVVCVDDGSRDATMAILEDWNRREPRVRAVSFSRNFGKEVGIAAGLDHARGRAVVLMDADLQHPPEVIPEFVAKWREGHAMVYGVRRDRATDGALRRFLSRGFYKLFAALSPTDLPEGAGDFRLMDRKVVDALGAVTERTRFTKGLYAWVGFKSAGVTFDVEERADGGASRFNLKRLVSFAIDGIAAFSTLPLRVWTVVGLVVSAFAFLYAAVILTRTLFMGVEVPGFASLIVSVMFFAGIQLVTLGVIGEYIGRIFVEVKGRPLYIVEREIGAEQVAEIEPVDARARAVSDSPGRG
jgi:glycosyltransferase involved in cell wall biosynthesis